MQNFGEAQSIVREKISAYEKVVSNDHFFHVLDWVYVHYILGTLDQRFNKTEREKYIQNILHHQHEDGFFYAGDDQKHHPLHTSAYALGALQLLKNDNVVFNKRLKPFSALTNYIHPRPSAHQRPMSLSMLDRLHFWRGSHKVGGVAAIMGALQNLVGENEAVRLLGVENVQNWLNGWALYWQAKMCSKDGFWQPAPLLLQKIFDQLYRFRHDPQMARMGAAAHLYWIFAQLHIDAPYGECVIDKILSLQQPSGLYENRPYCIDLDANFILRCALKNSASPLKTSMAINAMQKNAEAVLLWYAQKPVAEWPSNPHHLPGSLAAVAVAQTLSDLPSLKGWHDPFTRVWWL